MSKKASLNEKGRGFTVSASPFNNVKLDLALILFMGVVLLLLQERLLQNPLWQFLLIFSYGILAALWLLLRVKRIERQILEHNGKNQEQ